jgi:hypothetical protein
MIEMPPFLWRLFFAIEGDDRLASRAQVFGGRADIAEEE